MKQVLSISFICLLLMVGFRTHAQQPRQTDICFYGDTIHFTFDVCDRIDYAGELSPGNIREFYNSATAADYDSLINDLLAYRKKHKPDDWVFYQLIRKVAQQLSPKQDDYIRYTLYKWFLLN